MEHLLHPWHWIPVMAAMPFAVAVLNRLKHSIKGAGVENEQQDSVRDIDRR